MPALRQLTKSARLVFAIAALWLYCGGPVWAGDGGEDLGSLQALVNDMCTLVGLNPCPQLPTASQAALEFAGLQNSPVEMARAAGNIAPAINAGNPPLASPPSLSNPAATLSALSPLAFSGGTSPAPPTQLYDTAATNFLLYAVASGVSAQPDTLNLFYDDLAGTNNSFTKGSQTVARISLPLAILNKNNTETAVPTVLQIVAACSGGASCLTANAVGDFAGNGNVQTKSAASVGINFAAVFSASAVSSQPHLIFEVQVPLLVTRATDFPYFFIAATAQPYPLSPEFSTAFSFDDLGTKLSGSPIGLVPSAAPLCPSGATNCSTNPPPAVYPLCASLPSGAGGAVPAVAAFYAIATNGEALLSAPLTPTSPIACLF